MWFKVVIIPDCVKSEVYSGYNHLFHLQNVIIYDEDSSRTNWLLLEQQLF